MHFLYKSIARFSLLLIIFIGVAIFGSASTQAQEDQDYNYTASSGDSLTLLVRKAVLSLAQETEQQLSEGRIIAAETCAVQDLGSYQILAGEQYSIPRQTVVDSVDKAVALDETSEARWANYGPITTSLDQVGQGLVETDEVIDDNQNQTDDQIQDQPSATDQNDEDEALASSDQNDNDSAPWYWWLIGGGAVAGMWYILGGNEVIARRRQR